MELYFELIALVLMLGMIGNFSTNSDETESE